jgi:hypothetical protein
VTALLLLSEAWCLLGLLEPVQSQKESGRASLCLSLSLCKGIKMAFQEGVCVMSLRKSDCHDLGLYSQAQCQESDLLTFLVVG